MKRSPRKPSARFIRPNPANLWVQAITAGPDHGAPHELGPRELCAIQQGGLQAATPALLEDHVQSGCVNKRQPQGPGSGELERLDQHRRGQQALVKSPMLRPQAVTGLIAKSGPAQNLVHSNAS